MNRLEYVAIPTDYARQIQRGGTDAYNKLPQVTVSDGEGNQCRHCLKFIEKGREMLVFSYRPFATIQPFAETGPVFICSDECNRVGRGEQMPSMYLSWKTALIRGYDQHDKIVYGTGQVVEMDRLENEVAGTFTNPQVAYVHLRSSSYGCYQCRIECNS